MSILNHITKKKEKIEKTLVQAKVDSALVFRVRGMLFEDGLTMVDIVTAAFKAYIDERKEK